MLNITRTPGEEALVGATLVKYEYLVRGQLGKKVIISVNEDKTTLIKGQAREFKGFTLHLKDIKGKQITLGIESELKVRRL